MWNIKIHMKEEMTFSVRSNKVFESLNNSYREYRLDRFNISVLFPKNIPPKPNFFFAFSLSLLSVNMKEGYTPNSSLPY